MRIIVATTSFPSRASKSLEIPGNFVLQECLAYETAGATVEVVTPDIPGCPRSELFGENIQVHRFRYFCPRKWQKIKRPDGSALYDHINWVFFLQLPFFLLAFSWALFQHARIPLRANIVHCNWSICALAALPLRWLLNIPIVLTTRGSDVRLIPRWLNRFIFRKINGIIDCFGPDYRRILDDLPGKYLRLPVIVKTPELKQLPETMPAKSDEFLVVLVGRFDVTKRDLFGMPFSNLLAVMATLSEKHDVRCIYVGDGELRSELEKKALDLRLQGIVDFVGYQSNVFPFLKKANLVIGGVGLNAVSQEATLMGKVQLMPKIPFWFESIWFHKENALLYEPGSVESLLEGLEFALLSPGDMERMSSNAIETGKKYVTTVWEGGKIYLREFENTIKQNNIWKTF